MSTGFNAGAVNSRAAPVARSLTDSLRAKQLQPNDLSLLERILQMPSRARSPMSSSELLNPTPSSRAFGGSFSSQGRRGQQSSPQSSILRGFNSTDSPLGLPISASSMYKQSVNNQLFNSWGQPYKANPYGTQSQTQSSGASFDTGGAVTFNGGQGLEGTKQWESVIQRASQESGVPANVLRAIMGIESQGVNHGPNKAGATGLMQVVPTYWQDTANKYGGNLQDPYTNIRTAADILKMGYEQYGNDWNNAAAFYFGGGGAFEGGGYSDNADYFGTDISTYVNKFQQNLNAQTSASSGAWTQTLNSNVGSAIDVASQFIGKPYVYGGASPETSFDCSGLTQYSFRQAGIELPRTAQAQHDATTRISSEQAQAGDLIFFHSTYNNPRGEYITHVGIYLGNGKMLHAGGSTGVAISDITTNYWQQHFAGFGRTG